MKLKLKNFRCYENAEFDFGKEGITLLSGGSGKGKTTLLMAIEFALFGSGNKLQTYGKKFCSVELSEGDTFSIYRQKGPGRLIVTDNSGCYEDAAGEAVIKQRFGANLLACYIPQNMRKSFILMTPVERLEFLESFAFSDVDITDVKLKARNLAKSLNEEHTLTIGSLKSAKFALDQLTKPTVVPFPSKCSLGGREKAIDNEATKLKNCGIIIKRCEKELEQLKQENNDLSTLDKLCAAHTKQLDSLVNEMNELQSVAEPDFKLLSAQKERLASLLKNKKQIETLLLYNTNATRIQALKDAETMQLHEQLDKLKSTVWPELSSKETKEQLILWKAEIQVLSRKRMLEKSLRDNQSLRDITTGDPSLRDNDGSDGEEYDKMSSAVEDTTSKLNALKLQSAAQKECYTCPHCKSTLRLKNKELIGSDVEYQEISQETIKELVNLLSTQTEIKNTLKQKIETAKALAFQQDEIKKELATLEADDDAEKEFNVLATYQTENQQIERQIVALETTLKGGKFSNTIAQLEKENEKLKIMLDPRWKITVGDNDEEELKNCISTLEKEAGDFSIFSTRQKAISQKKRVVIEEIERLRSTHIQKWGEIRSGLIELIKAKDDEIEQVKTKRSKCEAMRCEIERYKRYETDLILYTRFQENYNTLEVQEASLGSQYTSACLFKDKILEAESIAIFNLVNNINTHAQFYLEKFFPDDPISVRLCAFKEMKDASKPQINLEIDYKGIEHDLGMLSGGEMSRVILAFTLALAEIHNVSFVMLDESTASLDQELTGTVIEGLKENFTGKLIILIAHQVVQGAFDTIVKL